MKAITLWQPWASLLACGAKRFETRSWATSYRGPITVHAAAKAVVTIFHEFDMDVYTDPEIFREIKERFQCKPDDLPRGCIIATAELVGCYLMETDTESGCVCIVTPEYGREMPSAQEYLFGDWTPGRYAWEFTNMKILDEPIPAKGKQRLWDWEDLHGNIR